MRCWATEYLKQAAAKKPSVVEILHDPDKIPADHEETAKILGDKREHKAVAPALTQIISTGISGLTS
jgi:hypothetical protein